MKTKSLSQVSVTTSREAEDAVASLLERLFGSPASIYAPEESKLSVVTVYTPERINQVHAKEEALQAGLEFLTQCQLRIRPAEVVMRKVAREDWSTSWRKYFKTLEFGPRLLIRPSWSRRQARPGQAVVTLDPGLSFGTGQHATTAFCLRQLVGAAKTGQNGSFLDIGTGSGILAIAAAKLGFKVVRAMDYDPVAVRIARANARRNRVHERVAITRADITQVPVKTKVQYDFICANLVHDLLTGEAARISARQRPGGRLAVAGLLTGQFGADSGNTNGVDSSCKRLMWKENGSPGFFSTRVSF
ncbi:MAG: 50S ribosomal protein L11 methyltransferase [Verrucomicrobiota bacterium]